MGSRQASRMVTVGKAPGAALRRERVTSRWEQQAGFTHGATTCHSQELQVGLGDGRL